MTDNHQQQLIGIWKGAMAEWTQAMLGCIRRGVFSPKSMFVPVDILITSLGVLIKIIRVEIVFTIVALIFITVTLALVIIFLVLMLQPD
jgi:hypothetical protein